MRIKILCFFLTAILLSCNEKQTTNSAANTDILKIEYAEGFKVETSEAFKIVTLTNPWPGADRKFRYLLKDKNSDLKVTSYTGDFDAVVEIPLESVVVTSTTHIPSLDMLGLTNRIKGFPGLDYISSESARKLIDQGEIAEIGQNESLNTEVLMDMNPDAVVGFAVSGANSTFSKLENAGIPVLYNSDWTETHPLGKAEWIKFFGVLFGKEKEAAEVFNNIEKDYLEAKDLAKQANSKPTVLSGAMYKDIWYMPQGNSWAARFIEDAHGDYLWNDTEGTGSLSMSLEAVLESGSEADFWIGPGQFTSLEQFSEAHSAYQEFTALQQGKVYSFTNKKGPTGGVIYYELAPNRPDLVLKDIITILHPGLLPDHELYFFTKVE